MTENIDTVVLREKFSQLSYTQGSDGQVTQLSLGDCWAQLEGVANRRRGSDAYYKVYSPGADGHDVVHAKISEMAGIEPVASKLVEVAAARAPRP